MGSSTSRRIRRRRAERAFGTLQDRLPKELHHAGITTLEAADRYRRDVYLPEHNARFAVAPEHPGTAFVADHAGVHRAVLCIQEERVVGNDNCGRYRNLILPSPPSPPRAHFVRARGRGHDYPNGTLAIFHGPRCLARYRADGRPLDDHLLAAQYRSATSPAGSVDKPPACPRAPQDHHNSGQTMCYQNRST